MIYNYNQLGHVATSERLDSVDTQACFNNALCPIFLNSLHRLLLLVEEFPEEDVFLPPPIIFPAFLRAPHQPIRTVQQSLQRYSERHPIHPKSGGLR